MTLSQCAALCLLYDFQFIAKGVHSWQMPSIRCRDHQFYMAVLQGQRHHQHNQVYDTSTSFWLVCLLLVVIATAHQPCIIPYSSYHNKSMQIYKQFQENVCIVCIPLICSDPRCFYNLKCVNVSPSYAGCVRSPDGEAVSWALVELDGQMGMGYTLPKYRHMMLQTVAFQVDSDNFQSKYCRDQVMKSHLQMI